MSVSIITELPPEISPSEDWTKIREEDTRDLSDR